MLETCTNPAVHNPFIFVQVIVGTTVRLFGISPAYFNILQQKAEKKLENFVTSHGELNLFRTSASNVSFQLFEARSTRSDATELEWTLTPVDRFIRHFLCNCFTLLTFCIVHFAVLGAIA